MYSFAWPAPPKAKNPKITERAGVYHRLEGSFCDCLILIKPLVSTPEPSPDVDATPAPVK